MKAWGWLPPRPGPGAAPDVEALIGGVQATLGRDLDDAERACVLASVDRLIVVARARRRSAVGRMFPRPAGRHHR